MIYSSDRIMTTHAGSLPRPDDLREMVLAKARGEPYDRAALDRQLETAVGQVVERQIECGLDIVNDGELSKPNFTDYVLERIAGCEKRPGTGRRPARHDGARRAEIRRLFRRPPALALFRRPNHAGLRRRIALCRAGRTGARHRQFQIGARRSEVAEAFLPANTPGTIEHWMANEHYPSDEDFLFGIAEVMREEYRAIVDAGFLLQIDDPDLPDGWACLPDISLPDYRKYAMMRIDALNHALRDIPSEKIRLHVCWGSFHGPHHDDIPLKDIIDLIFRVRRRELFDRGLEPVPRARMAGVREVKLPEGATLIPGVVGHCTDFIEHPDLVAERLVRYASRSAARMCSPAPIAGSARGSATPRSAGPSSRRWPKAHAAPRRPSGAAYSRGSPVPSVRFAPLALRIIQMIR